MLWVVLAAGAGTLQAIRNALARNLGDVATPALVSWARFAFNLPFSALLAFWLWQQADALVLTAGFFFACTITAVTQLLGNVALVTAFRHTSFAASIVLHKLEVVFTAIVGTLLFAELPSTLGWLGVALCAGGVLAMNLKREGGRIAWSRILHFDLGATLSLACALLLVAASFALKEANELFATANPEIGSSRFEAAAHTLFHTTWIEVAILSVWLLVREPRSLAQVRPLFWRMLPIGAVGFAGSLGWFWAYSLTLVAYVKAVGQIEAVIAVLLGLLWWKEADLRGKLPGIALVLLGIAFVLLG
ncbi:MAG: hypothetical protein QNK05_05555 [Myxococcota bacterium]|nr:hypothetical protein [Myxococcota bacterium]